MKAHKNLLAVIPALIFTLFFFHQATAQVTQGYQEPSPRAALAGSDTGQQTQSRGIFQPRESRLVYQLEGLTEDQLSRIDELHESHREKVAELLEQRRDNEITRQQFLAQRRLNFDRHQDALKQILTKAQWEQLRQLRAERRNRPVDD